MSKIKGIGSIEGPLEVEDTTDATTTTSASIQTDGGISAVKKIIAGQGIYLGGVAAANLLDDFETGDWTPVVSDASSGGNTASLGTAIGKYVKINGLVFLLFEISNINTAGMTAGNDLFVQNVPFASSAANPIIIVGSVESVRIAFAGPLYTFMARSNAYFRFRSTTSSGDPVTTIVSDVTSGQGDLYGNISYLV